MIQQEHEQEQARKPGARRNGNRRVPRIALIAILVLIVAVVATLGATLLFKGISSNQTQGGANTTNTNHVPLSFADASGVVNFLDNKQQSSDHSASLSILINSLPTVPAGYQYNAWLVDSQKQSLSALSLGTLSLKDGNYILDYPGSSTNLLSLGDTVEITYEHGNVSAPTGKVILSATFPPKSFAHIRDLLVSFPTTPGKVGLLVGMIGQAQQLSAFAHSLQSMDVSQKPALVQCAAQNILNIVEGTHGANYHALASTCQQQSIQSSGDGFGLLGSNGYVATAMAQVNLTVTQSDATSSMITHSRHVGYGLTDMQKWLTTIDQDALSLLKQPANQAKLNEVITLSNQVLNGVDLDHDGTVDYVPGEAGATIAYAHTQLMATLILTPAS